MPDEPSEPFQSKSNYTPPIEDDDDDELREPFFHNADPLKATLNTFRRFLILDEPAAVYAVLATVIANRLPGEPIWLGLVGPPSSAKTKIVNSISGLSDVHTANTIASSAALLSGSSRKERSPKAKGGLLKEIGDFGILVIKDFTSIISMRLDSRIEVLGAFREIWDGAWTRHVGADGGVKYEWKGKLGLIFGVTEAYDLHYSIINALGTRFLLMRVFIKDEWALLPKALEYANDDPGSIDRQLARTVAALFVTCAGREPRPLEPEELARLNRVAVLSVRLRGTVERDGRTREVVGVHQAEGTPRLGRALERLLAALDILGVEREEALQLVERIALDSTPPLRLRAYNCLSPSLPMTVKDVQEALGGLPKSTTAHALEELQFFGLAVGVKELKEDGSEKQGVADNWLRKDDWLKGQKTNGSHP